MIAGTVVHVATRPLATRHGTFVAHELHDLAAGQPLVVVAAGDLGAPAPLLARVHSSCVTSETLGACDCDCAEQLAAALAQVAAAGRGVVFYLAQEGRGAGFVAKARDRMLVQASGRRLTTFDAYAQMGIAADTRRYEVVAHACRALGVTASLRLLTNNPAKHDELAAAGVAVAGTMPLLPTWTSFNRHHLVAKARSGHTLDTPAGDPEEAALPESVAAIAPHPVAGAPDWLVLARYLLPVRREAPVWFRLAVHLHVRTRAERIVLAHGRADDARPPLVRVQPDRLLERFPLVSRPARETWRAATDRMAAHGAGVALLLPPDHELDGAAAALLAAHLPARGVRVLVARGEDSGLDVLARAGLALGAPVTLATHA